MYQSFDTPTHDEGPARLAALREELQKRGLAGFLVPRADKHQGEYVPARDERLRWLTGFTGSAGSCVAMLQEAAVFIDGRYTVQAREQLDASAFTPVRIEETKSSEWLRAHVQDGDVIGYDPWLHTSGEIEHLTNALKDTGASLRGEVDNPIDAIWPDQPPAPMGSAFAQPEALAGKSSQDKRRDIVARFAETGLEAVILTLPDSICWLMNMRGGDVAHTPLALCFAVLRADATVTLYIDEDKVDGALRAHLGDGASLAEPDQFEADVAALTGKIGLDKGSAPARLSTLLQNAEIVWTPDPCIAPKARKTTAELDATRKAHRRDGAALARFLCWLDSATGVTEIDAAKKLEEFRAGTDALEDISFDTISAYGPHAALPHYRVSHESNAALHPGGIYLVDSGAQYRDGTTDVTRTVFIAGDGLEPSNEQKRAFTLVLRGMIAVSRARFPAGTTGAMIDVLARSALWNAGLDYDHGTGHGVGAFLSVHEGGQGISKRWTQPLAPGMILSNEPGYYKEGAFGIRIENLVVVHEPETPNGGERAMQGFETITFAPIDTRLVAVELLTHEECEWLNRYHEQVYETLFPIVDSETKEWLELATAPV